MTELPDAIRAMVQRWELRQDGAVIRGSAADVLPVRTVDGVLAVLKLGVPRPEGEHEHLVLRQWGGAGAVRLLRADPYRRALLLERAYPQSLGSRSDIDACEVVAGLYQRLHVPAMPQLPSVTAQLVVWTQDFEALSRNAPIPHRLVEQAITLSRDLMTDVAGSDVVLHGNLHYGNVLAAEREPWLAISPTPHNGDPHYELAPMLLHRWDELSSGIRDGVRARFYTLVDAAGLDEDRARAWAVVRVVHEATRELTRGRDADTATLTKYVALAKAVQD